MPTNLPNNLQIAELLRDVAAAYELQNSPANKFKIIAYQRAADAVEHATSELKDLWDDGKLEDVPGIGPSIAEHLDQLLRTGRSIHFNSLLKDIPPEAFKLMELPGIGIKTALRLIAQGKPSEVKLLLKQVAEKEKKAKRHLLPYADEVAGNIIKYLLQNKNVIKAQALGSIRRRAATVGDIDILASTQYLVHSTEIIKHFTNYPNKSKVIEAGEHTASILLPNGMQIDLMVVTEEIFGSALQHFTGSKHHNISLRELALKKGLSLSEYGIKENGKVKEFETEEKFYNFLGLEYIEPELREDFGEIKASETNTLPKLVELKDIKADLQIHSDFDIETSHDVGLSSGMEVVKKAEKLGYEYIAFTDHNPSQKGHTQQDFVEILKRKQEYIEHINYSIKKMNTNYVHRVFNSLEIDILSDGKLPVPEAGLELLDFCLVSIHSSFNLHRDEMTKRVLSALSHPKALIFAHPTTRKLNEREGVELDWPEIFEFCLKNNKWIEINADPMRLDLPDTLVREAIKLGVKLTLGTDAHHIDHMDNMKYAVDVARRGWCEAGDIINTKSLVEFEKSIR